MPGFNINKKGLLLYRLLLFTLIYQTIIGILFCLHFFVFPHSPIHLTSEIKVGDLVSWVYWSYGVVFTWMALTIVWTFAMIYFMLLFYYLFFIPIYSKEFVLGLNVRKRKSVENMRQIKIFTLVYRCIEIIINMQNEITSFTLVPLQSEVMYHCMFCYMVAIRMHQKFNATAVGGVVTFATGILLAWLLALKIFGQVGSWNKKTLKSWTTQGKMHWKNKADIRYMKKFQKSCKPLCVAYKTYFIVKPFTVLRCLMKIMTVIFKALLLTKNGI